MKNYICKIYTDNEANQIGFFCYIPYKNKKISVLITNNNAINEKNIKKNKTIKLLLYNDLENKDIDIFINDNRFIYINKEYNISIIEIKP